MRAARFRPTLFAAGFALAAGLAPGAQETRPSASPTPFPPELPPMRAGVYAGTLTKLDLGRRALVILVPATSGKDAPATPATEVELRVTPASRFVSRGRDVAFEDLRSDARVTATWRDGVDRRRELVLLRLR